MSGRKGALSRHVWQKIVFRADHEFPDFIGEHCMFVSGGGGREGEGLTRNEFCSFRGLLRTFAIVLYLELFNYTRQSTCSRAAG